PSMWDPQREVLAAHHVVAPAIYGRGNSMDAWASSIRDELGDEPFVAVGASMGGGCAVAMARQGAPVRAIVLSGAHAGPDAPERRPQREATIDRLRREGAEALWAGNGPAPPAEHL